MIFVWFLLFLAWPVAEIAFFVEVGQAIGWIWAILLAIGTSIAGSVLMRVQGMTALNRFLQESEKGELPVAAVLDGMGIFLAGVLLLLPGFLTDFVGLLLFVPPVRRRVIGFMFRQFLRKPAMQWQTRRAPFSRGPAGPAPRDGGRGFRRDEDVIDAEFETIDPERKPGSPRLVNRRDDELP
jgi:UPF0716 protein FxsA